MGGGRLEPGHQLSRHSCAVFTSMPTPRPQWFSPLTEALRPARPGRLPSGGHAPRQTVTQRPGMPGGPADLLPGAVQADADGAVARTAQDGHRSAEPLPAQPSLPVPVTGLAVTLALTHQPSQVTLYKLQQHRKARALKADPLSLIAARTMT
jgi:hypothetical protein